MESGNTARTRTEKIRAWLGGKTGKTDIAWALLLYIAGAAAHYFAGSFPKKITTYADELLYYTIAQSIHDGGGIMCLNAHTVFKKAAYSLVISPFFGIDDPVLRVEMITLFNSALIMTTLFFVYLIGRELGLNRGSMLAALTITAVWPDMLYSVTFMTENLNWPLTMLAIWLWLKSKRSVRGAVYSAALGAVCYIGYLCKDIFLALLLSAAAFEAAYPLVTYLSERGENRRGLGEYWSRQSLIRCGISLAVFAVCFAAGNLLLFGKADPNVAGAVAGGLDNLKSGYAVLYLLYAFVYYLAASFVAVLVMPIAYPAACFKRMDGGTRSLFSFLVLYLTVSCAMIAYTISINEDFGLIMPRGHLRYFGFILLLLAVVLLKVLQDGDGGGKFSRKRIIFTLAAAFVSCMVFKGFSDELATIDQSALNVYHAAAVVVHSFIEKVGEKKFYVISFVSFAVCAVIILIVHYYKSKGRSGASACVFTVFMLMLCVQNGRLELAQYKEHYSTDSEMISGVTELNRCLDGSDGNILYICSSRYSLEHKTFTTYFDHLGRLCVCYEKDLPRFAADGRVIDVPNTDFGLRVTSFEFSYDKFDGFDHIITDRKCGTELRGVSRVDGAGGGFYTLYRNAEPAAVEFVPDAYAGEPLEISFADGGRDAEKYCASGTEEISDVTWTNRDRVPFRIPVLGEYGAVVVAVDVAETYNGTAQRYIAVQGGEILCEGTLTGSGTIVFTVPVKDGELSFDIVCPTAVGKNDDDEAALLSDDTDKRYAFALNRVTVGG